MVAGARTRLGSALALKHGDPSRQWSLLELSRASAMSRTAFATHAKAVAGIPPLAYLTEWQMRQAERALRKGGISVASVAHSVGYHLNVLLTVKGCNPKRPLRGRNRTVSYCRHPTVSRPSANDPIVDV